MSGKEKKHSALRVPEQSLISVLTQRDGAYLGSARWVLQALCRLFYILSDVLHSKVLTRLHYFDYFNYGMVNYSCIGDCRVNKDSTYSQAQHLSTAVFTTRWLGLQEGRRQTALLRTKLAAYRENIVKRAYGTGTVFLAAMVSARRDTKAYASGCHPPRVDRGVGTSWSVQP